MLFIGSQNRLSFFHELVNIPSTFYHLKENLKKNVSAIITTDHWYNRFDLEENREIPTSN